MESEHTAEYKARYNTRDIDKGSIYKSTEINDGWQTVLLEVRPGEQKWVSLDFLERLMVEDRDDQGPTEAPEKLPYTGRTLDDIWAHEQAAIAKEPKPMYISKPTGKNTYAEVKLNAGSCSCGAVRTHSIFCGAHPSNIKYKGE
jgi:hypothetical protein